HGSLVYYSCVLDPGDKIVDCPPTFTMYEFDAAVNGALVIKVPRKPDFSLNVEQIAEVVKQEKPKCIFLTSPNNPDGSIIDDDVLLKILDLPILVILDEAYIEFSAIESRMSWVKKHENLIVLRTFSKRAGILLIFFFPYFTQLNLRPFPSHSNFILCEVTSGKDAKKLKEDLAQMGVMIRHYDKKELKGYVRVTVGKPEQTNVLMKCLKKLS
ncbi:histidinol-phosphate aminotransferase 1, chloroplastic-like, partial [Vigna radiata var. radiata]|uniref:histidinol-phosphate transaminase n=1 Tax=Vigna radiata var. radiata TaxID=3916 RepID=A0A1S3VBB2_VIGRR